jgi:putative endonuclease
MPFQVYIMYSKKCDKYYIGHTDSMDRRLKEHNSGQGGKFSSGCHPWVLVYTEEFETRWKASKREREIKQKKSRKYIEWLIAGKGG